MILDTLDNWKKYAWSLDRFRRAFEFLEGLAPDTADGTYRLDEDDVYCMLQGYETKPIEGHEYEAHRNYADIQYMIEGEESILWAPQRTLTVTKPYKPDIEFYSLTPNPVDIILTPGRFCVLLPDDAHAPCIAHGAPVKVRKAVVKVRL
jgi:YhcH/YjgK/YiaL family protein